MHLENHLQWMALINKHSARFKDGIQGIALTGWQRYNHFLELCELLPVSVISLALCLDVSKLGYFEPNYNRSSIISTLSCPLPLVNVTDDRWLDLNTNEMIAFEYTPFRSCLFPGNKAMLFSLEMYSSVVKARDFLIDITYNQHFLSTYEMKYRFGSSKDIGQSLEKYVEPLLLELNDLRSNASKALTDVYDDYTIDEIIEQNITPWTDALIEIKKKAKYLLSIEVWPQRPLNRKSIKKQQTLQKNYIKDVFML